MLIQKKKGNIHSVDTGNKKIDWLQLEWFETNKRILHKRTNTGIEVSLKFLKESAELTQGDILFEDERSIIAVEVIPCECLVIKPADMFEMASICYEIGNKHLPLFYEDGELLVPFENPMFRLLEAKGHAISKAKRKLLNQLKTTVTPHGLPKGDTLFSRIMKLSSDE